MVDEEVYGGDEQKYVGDLDQDLGDAALHVEHAFPDCQESNGREIIGAKSSRWLAARKSYSSCEQRKDGNKDGNNKK